MATAEMAAMLDELMGRNRNAGPNEKIEEVTWEDESVCKYFLVDFCPHDVFVNTKVDLGPCPNIHSEDLRHDYKKADFNHRKSSVEDDFIRFCQKMINDLGHKIRRSKDRLQLNKLEQQAAAGLSQEKQQEIEQQIAILTEKINILVDKAEKAGCEGDVEEAQGVLKLCDQLREEREELKKQIGIKPSENFNQVAKPMEVCETCGSFLIINDAQSRIEDHIKGKQHIGYSKVKESLENMLELRRQRREDREKEREKKKEEDRESGERSSKEKDEDRSSRDKNSKSRKSRSRSRDRRRRSRSRSRDRRRRSRSRDYRRRSRSRDHRRRSRSRDHRRRSRSRDRRRSRSRDGGRRGHGRY